MEDSIRAQLQEFWTLGFLARYDNEDCQLLIRDGRLLLEPTGQTTPLVQHRSFYEDYELEVLGEPLRRHSSGTDERLHEELRKEIESQEAQFIADAKCSLDTEETDSCTLARDVIARLKKLGYSPKEAKVMRPETAITALTAEPPPMGSETSADSTDKPGKQFADFKKGALQQRHALVIHALWKQAATKEIKTLNAKRFRQLCGQQEAVKMIKGDDAVFKTECGKLRDKAEKLHKRYQIVGIPLDNVSSIV